MTDQTIADEGILLVRQRCDDPDGYGDPAILQGMIAHLWTGYLNARFLANEDPTLIEPVDVVRMMELLKLARRTLRPNEPDDMRDGFGYLFMEAVLRGEATVGEQKDAVSGMETGARRGGP